MIVDNLRTRNNGIKLKCKQVKSDCIKFFFTNVVVREWNKLPPSVVQCNTIDSFKNKLDRHFLELNINYYAFQRQTNAADKREAVAQAVR